MKNRPRSRVTTQVFHKPKSGSEMMILNQRNLFNQRAFAPGVLFQEGNTSIRQYQRTRSVCGNMANNHPGPFAPSTYTSTRPSTTCRLPVGSERPLCTNPRVGLTNSKWLVSKTRHPSVRTQVLHKSFRNDSTARFFTSAGGHNRLVHSMRTFCGVAHSSIYYILGLPSCSCICLTC